jgi:hypothetical protein
VSVDREPVGGGKDPEMTDKSPKKSNDKKQGRSLMEKRMAKRQKRSQRQDDAAARGRLEGH